MSKKKRSGNSFPKSVAVNRVTGKKGGNHRLEALKVTAVPPEALQQIRVRQKQIVQLQNELNAYTTGVRIGMGLKGEYMLDPAKGQFIPTAKGKT